MQRIAAIWSHLRLLLRSRLSRRVGAAVFLSIFAIEAIILLPSYRNYERDLLAGLEREGRATIKSLFRFGYHADSAEFERAGAMVIRDSRLIGGALYRFFGSAATQFGDPPTLLPNAPSNSEIVRKRSADGRHYDVIWPGSGIAFGSVYAVAVRLDTSWVAGELVAFVWRIAGLAL